MFRAWNVEIVIGIFIAIGIVVVTYNFIIQKHIRRLLQTLCGLVFAIACLVLGIHLAAFQYIGVWVSYIVIPTIIFSGSIWFYLFKVRNKDFEEL